MRIEKRSSAGASDRNVEWAEIDPAREESPMNPRPSRRTPWTLLASATAFFALLQFAPATVGTANAQLIDTESGTNLWVNSFAYETSSLIDLQDKLMGRIATSLNDEVIKSGVRHEVGTLAADHNRSEEHTSEL